MAIWRLVLTEKHLWRQEEQRKQHKDLADRKNEVFFRGTPTDCLFALHLANLGWKLSEFDFIVFVELKVLSDAECLG